MITPASGEADSPIANRGWVPRSSSTTRSPSRRATIASSDPPNPEPTMARSTSSGAVTHDGRRDALGPIHDAQPRGAIGRAPAGEEAVDVPQIGEHTSASRHDTVFDHRFECGEMWQNGANGFHGAIAATGRDHGADARTGIEGDVDRSTAPLDRLPGAHEGWLQEDESAHVDVVVAEEPGGAREVVE